jgi:putative colanic acid biosynthesis acetyltransferase WcaF
LKLASFDNKSFDKGASRAKQVTWLVFGSLLFSSWLPGSAWRRVTLRIFGSKLGSRVVIKPRVMIKFPWKLEVGDDSWIGESVWIDNLAKVSIGSNVCVSQSVYLCTGNHRWDRESFDLLAQPIIIESKSWVGARSEVGPGVTIREGAILTLGSCATNDLHSWKIYSGNPAKIVKDRPAFS